CQFYNRKDGICNQQNNCNRLHVCRHFLHGECKFLPCKRSHNLLSTHELRLLESAGIDWKIAANIQAIYDHRHVEFNKKLKGKIPNYKPQEKLWKHPPVRSRKPRMPLEKVSSTLHVSPSEVLFIQFSHAGPSSNVLAQNGHQLPTGAGGQDEGETDASSAKASKASKEAECDEICVFYVWRYCKYKEKCRSVHYHLPYRWQVFDGVKWNDLSGMEEIEKAYCDPNINSIEKKSINFRTMTCRGCLLQRLSTPSWVTRPTFVLTTEWIWYWKNDLGQWVEYGGHGEGDSVKSPHSAIIENLYQADPDAMVSFQAGLQHYQLDFKAMVQTNTSSKTRRRVCRRPKFVSYEDVQKIKQGQRDSSIPNQVCPNHWDQTALPEFGYKAVEISNTTSEYSKIKQMFHQTMKSYTVLKIRRIQNPSLWKVFQWQKEQMKRENGGKEVNERLLFHGTHNSFLEPICIHNFDWRICGSNGTNYGKGIYFARDASYCHGHCQPAVKKHSMFVARVLVGDYVTGYSSYVRPPPKSGAGLRFYDSCVDNELNPSVFVVFEKNQIYPEYIIEYKA
ncbi:PAR12 polymerase, partial [Alcedo cyanopectus]|nr:PAR12 polymerase [Ceyx cyanopectus]